MKILIELIAYLPEIKTTVIIGFALISLMIIVNAFEIYADGLQRDYDKNKEGK